MEFWHLTVVSKGRQHAFPDDRVRLAAVRTLARVLEGALLLFCVADDHAHIVVRGTRAEAGRMGQRTLLALHPVTRGVGLLPAHIEPVAERRHLYSLVRYVLQQTEHHGLPWHPARWEGSCLADLVGARVRVPRDAFDGEQDDWVRQARPRDIREAAAAAVCRPTVTGKTPPEVGARRVAALVLHRSGATAEQVAAHLGISRRSARRQIHAPVDPRLEQAVCRQLALRLAIPEPRLARMAS